MIVDDLVQTVRGTRLTRATRLRPFAICICPCKREELKREMSGFHRISDPTYQTAPLYGSVRVYGALIGSIACVQPDKR